MSDEMIAGELYSITFNGKKYYILDVATGAFAFTASEFKKLNKEIIRKKGLFGSVVKVFVPLKLRNRAYRRYISLLKHPSVVKKLNKIYYRV